MSYSDWTVPNDLAAEEPEPPPLCPAREATLMTSREGYKLITLEVRQ